MAKRDAAVVLDTWPVVRLYDGTEPAATEVRDLLRRRPGPRPVMSAANFTEVCYILANDYGPEVAIKLKVPPRKLKVLPRKLKVRRSFVVSC